MDETTSDLPRAALVLLVCIACVTALAPPSAAAAPNDGEQTYVITQGDQEIVIVPVGNGSQTVEEFYDYRTPETHDPPDYLYSSYGTTEYQEDDTSVLMLYEGSDGLSLVLLHGKLEGDTRGGSLTMQIDGLPEEGEWVIEDDTYTDYNGPLDTFDHDGTSSRITWIWSEGRNDGGAFNGGLDGDDWEITIEPYFNENADYRYEDPVGYDGQVDDWKVVSGDGDSHTSTSLQSIDEPITITPGGTPEMSISSFSTTKSSAEPGETIELRADVANVGDASGTFDIGFTSEGEEIDTQSVTLDGGESEQLTTELTFDEPGSYEVGVNGTTTSVEIIEDPSNGTGENGVGENGTGGNGGKTDRQGPFSDDGLSGFGVLAALLALVATLAIGCGRRPE